jgi:hypothetical protein
MVHRQIIIDSKENILPWQIIIIQCKLMSLYSITFDERISKRFYTWEYCTGDVSDL